MLVFLYERTTSMFIHHIFSIFGGSLRVIIPFVGNQMCAWGILLLILLNWNAGYCFSPPTRHAFLLPSSTKSFLKKHQQQGAFRCRLLFVVAATPDWTNRPDDKVVQIQDNTHMDQIPLFDALYNSETGA